MHSIPGDQQARHAWLIGLLGITLLVLNSLFLQVRTALYYDDTTDLSAFFAAAQVKQEQNNGIYSLELLRQQSAHQVHGRIRPYLYPPWFAETLSVFAGDDYVKFRIGWSVFGHACLGLLFLVTLRLIRQFSGGLTATTSLVCLAGFALFAPIERELFYGQLSLLLALLLWLAVAQFPQRRDVLSGALVGVAAMVKIYPVLMLAWFLANRRYRSLAGCGAVVAAIAGLSVFHFGAADWIEFFRLHLGGGMIEQAYSNSREQFMNVPNHSPSHVIYILGTALDRPVSTGTALWLGRWLSAGTGLLFLWYTRRTLWAQRHSMEALVSLIIGMMLVSPVLWNHVYVFLLPALLVFLAAALEREAAMPDLALLLPAALAIAVADYSTNIDLFNHPALVLLKPVKLYALLLLLAFAGRRIRRETTLSCAPTTVRA